MSIRYFCLLLCVVLMSSCKDQYVYTPPAGVQTPNDVFGDMYKEILIMDTVGISRQIADGFPSSKIRDIKLAFRKQKNDEGFDVQKFINDHWILAEPRKTNYIAKTESNISELSSEMWDALEYNSANQKEFSSLIALPHTYIPISGQQIEMRYFDSYFIMVGLAADGKWNMVRNMLDNCAYMIDQIGHVPETNRTYMTSRSGQPFFSHMVELLATKEGNQIYTKYLPQLIKEHSYWHKGENVLEERNGIDHTIKIGDKLLNRYSDPNSEPRDENFLEDKRGGNSLYRAKRANSESGWTMSSRWLGDNKRMWTMFTRSVAAIDLNALLFHLEKTILKAYSIEGKNDDGSFETKMIARKEALDSLHWDDNKKIFEDVNYRKEQRTGQATLAMLYPLFTKMCSQEQADDVASFVSNSLLKSGGLMDSDDYSEFEWDAPYGHAPLQYIAAIGLDNYGYKDLAKKVARRYIQTIENTFSVTGRMTEKYNLSETDPEKMAGNYKGKDSYGWTLGVYLGLKEYLKE